MAVIKKWNNKFGNEAEFLVEQDGKYCHYKLSNRVINLQDMDEEELANYEDEPWVDFFDEQVDNIKDIEM